MSKTTMLLKATIFISFSAWIAAGQESPPAKPLEWGAQAGPWRLSISASKARYLAGEDVDVNATLQNTSDRPVAFLNSGLRLYTIDLRLPVPDWIPWKPRAPLLPSAYPRDGDVKGLDKPAGSKSSTRWRLNGLFDLSAPGDYHVTFATEQPVTSYAQAETARQERRVKVISNEIVITILPKGK